MDTPEQATPAIVLDNRGLEPPEPMMRVLEALSGLADDQTLIAINDREPMFLYPHLEERGYLHETTPHADGAYRIVVWRATNAQASPDAARNGTVPAPERPAVLLDVRDVLRRHEEPFAQIMAAIQSLPAGEDLILVTTFEPIPLYKVLERQGFGSSTTQAAPDEWHIRFTRKEVQA